jgi:decaprenylphospho-beta-D-erythro-pentofuranosid-2-ulose 2-reductase
MSAAEAAPGASGARVVVLGGTSEIAIAVVRALQERGPREVALVGRDRARLADAARQLEQAGCPRVVSIEADALDTARHGEVLERATSALGGADLVIVAVGVLGERGGLPEDIAGAVQVLEVNLVGAGSLLLHAARSLRAQGGGSILVLSSVAAERPRRSNAVYGASKAGLDALAQGVGDDLYDAGVRVCVVRPGFVTTRMTAGLRPAPLSTTPEAVARAAVRGLERGAHTVWVPPALRLVMGAVGLLPRPVFRRVPL